MRAALIIVCIIFLLSVLILLIGGTVLALIDDSYLYEKIDDITFKLFIVLFCGSIGAFIVLGVVALVMRVVNG